MKRDILIGAHGTWPYANYYLYVGHLAALLTGDVNLNNEKMSKSKII